MRRAALIALVILASCSGNGETTETTLDSPPLTSLAESEQRDAPAQTTTSTEPPATTTTTPTTTTTIPANAKADFGLSQVVFGEASFVVITNWGDGPGSLRGYWLSQATALQALPDIELAPAGQAVLGIGGDPPPELAAVATVEFLGRSIGFISAESGEVALHRGDAFDDPQSLVAYVSWGVGPHQRSEQAVEAGLWEGDAVAVFDDAPSISSGVFPAISSADWSVDIGG